METKSTLISVPASEYGDHYRDHCLSMYHGFVESAEKISDRRHSANSFFLTVNTALLGITGYLQSVNTELLWLVALAGCVLSYTWYRLIGSYRILNTAKFKVIHEIEQQLPFAPFDAEWEYLDRGKVSSVHIPFSKVEAVVPLVFLTLHAVALVAILAGGDPT